MATTRSKIPGSRRAKRPGSRRVKRPLTQRAAAAPRLTGAFELREAKAADDGPRRPREVVRYFEGEVDRDEVGAKVARLHALGRANVSVPGWLCLTAGSEDSAAPSAEEQEELLGQFDASFEAGDRVAVRASVAGEERLIGWDPNALFESFLHVDREALLATVTACLASVRTPSAQLERKVRGLDGRPLRAAVLIQAMIDARASGTLSTDFEPAPEPAEGQPQEGPRVSIRAGLGLGVGVSSGWVECDAYVADVTSGRLVSISVAEKTARVVVDRDRGQGTTLQAVPPAEGKPRALSDGDLAKLCKLAKAVGEHLEGPHRVEWALDRRGVFHVLEVEPDAGQREQVFDLEPTLEWYPTLCPPLSYSLAARACGEALAPALGALGLPGRARPEARVLANDLLALINGRLTLNLHSGRGLVRAIPAWQTTLSAWDEAFEHAAGAAEGGQPPGWWTRARGALRLDRLSLTLGLKARRLAGQVAAAHREAEVAAREADALRLHTLTEALLERFLPAGGQVLLADALARAARRRLEAAAAEAGVERPAALAMAALSSAGEHAALQPLRSFMRLADLARAEPDLVAALTKTAPPEQAWDVLHARAADDPVRVALDRHLERFGHRVPNELNLEAPTFGDAALLVGLLGSAVQRDYEGRTVLEVGRDRARLEVSRVLKAVPLARRVGLWLALARWRRLELIRESLRDTTALLFDALRRLYEGIGGELAGTGLLEDGLDVFWLTRDEVAGLYRGQTVDRDLRSLVALRAAEYERFAALPPCPRLQTRGIVAANHLAGSWVERQGPVRGVGAAPGQATGRVAVVPALGPAAPPPGAIVVATALEPGQAVLLASAAGLVLETREDRYAGVFCRALGIPAVIGVRGATRRLRDGQQVELDAETGEVRPPTDA